ncbi:MAG: ribonucleoside-diphosphate reductase, adenosylcobalamin-dependent [Nitrospira bacterium HGW-Nitrospira-1]|nr:MAG: ribonucleoside-diphosphate reductase, adenosylcobalamin-dependent [Nitrospira bacterium HGW-Nitrospira-1]
MKGSVSSIGLTPNSLKVLEKRYLQKDEEGKPTETPEELFRRVAKTIASADLMYGKAEAEVMLVEEDFYAMMTSLDFLPNSPTLMNAGRRLGQLSACFVLPIEDSMESIFEAVKHTAIIHKSGGGTGFSFSNLRPGGDIVGSTKGVSSGPISFMTVFDTATEAVKQGGTRRGANMGILRVDHPDILNFISSKDDNSRFNNFNISVAITDTFMQAVRENSAYDLINPRTKKKTLSLNSREVFDIIVNHAWKNGEPGLVFIDRINSTNPTPKLGAIEATNPCGEQPLLPYESCNLGSINLARMVIDSEVDYTRLKRLVWKSVHFLDNVIDVNKYPLQKIADITLANRKIGLGVMGWADMLIQMGAPYNSDKAIQLASEVMGFISREAHNASAALAEERGVFPNYAGSIYDGRMKQRNATVTTIAPTGTLSILAGCSSGVEPLFAVSYVRTVMEGTKLLEVNPYFEKAAHERGFWSRELMEEIAQKGSLHDFTEIPEDIRAVFLTAHDISPRDHIAMQAAFQKYVDNAVSKTVNFSHNATTKDVEDVYLFAYELGCKGVTVYRDGSREEQVLSTGSTKQTALKEAAPAAPKTKIVPRERPEANIGKTRRMKTGCGTIYITVNEDEHGSLFEVFTHMGKAGGCASSQAEAIGRLVSLALRSNIEPDAIISQLKGITCHQQIWSNGGKITSCSDAIAKALEKYTEKDSNGNGNGNRRHSEAMLMGACPECGGSVEHEGGCAVCHSCGFTKCG